MKKVSLLVLGLLGIGIFGGFSTVQAAEEFTETPVQELKSNLAPEEVPEVASARTARAVAPKVTYRTHVQKIGWQGWKSNGQASGTSGQAKRLEAIQLKLENTPVPGGIEYRTHVEKIGWQGWKSNGQLSGTSGQAKRLEAIQIRLTGQLANEYDVFYRVHAQKFGWMGWEKGGLPSGTAGHAYRLEAIEIKLVPKKVYLNIDRKATFSFRSNRVFPGQLDPNKYGANAYVKNGLRLFKDSKSAEFFADTLLNDPNNKAVSADLYVLRQGLKTIGYTVNFYFTY